MIDPEAPLQINQPFGNFGRGADQEAILEQFVEPMVEIYQGYHAAYEYAGGPRAETDDFQVNIHGGYRPLGFYWNALKKGYKLGVQASSDHIATHNSYTLIYSPSVEREEIVESMRKRHAYGSTDNIILDFRADGVHMMGDALGTVAIIIGAIGIRYTGWQQIDPALSIAIGVLIVWTAWDIVNEALNILLEGLPRGLELESVICAMREVPGVLDVHDLHIWSLGSSTHALSCHALIEDVPPSASEHILQCLKAVLCDRFAIHHTTVQFEHVGCAVSESGCVIRTSAHAHHQH